MTKSASGELSLHRRRSLAWSSFILICLLFAGGLLLGTLSRGVPTTSDWGGENFLTGLFTVTGFFAFPTVGIIIANRRSDSTIGWICLAIGFAWGVVIFGETYALYGLRANPGSLPLAKMGVVITNVGWAPAIVMTSVFLVLLFPDGKPPTPRWRPVLWVAGTAALLIFVFGLIGPGDYADAGYPDVENPIGIEALRPLEPLLYAFVALIPICFLASAAGLVVRYRRSRDTERLQLKWLVTAGVTVAVLFAVAMVLGIVWDSPEAPPPVIEFFQSLAVMSFALIPIAIALAVLKHRLYDIDVVINKTLVYGALAVFITIAYIGIVVGIGRAVGSERDLGLSIAATAVVAAAFQPVRDRAQRVANRLVYGKRATPYDVLSEFSGGVAQLVATEDLLPRMARLVCEATGAVRADIWLSVGSDLVPEGSWPPDVTPPQAAMLRGSEILAGDNTTEIPVRHQGELLGAIGVEKPPGEILNPTEVKLLEDLASQAGLVLRNVRLIEDLKISRQRLVNAQDEERRRLERDLHDGAQQRLVAIALALKMARGLVMDDAQLGQRIDQASDELALALAELREFARGIHPAILTERGLGPALHSLVERSPVPATLESSLNGRLPLPVETAAYFVVSEALANVAKYSKASIATITAGQRDGSLEIVVSDDGVGGADPNRGSGLRGLADRVAVVDGTLELDSPPGKGTTLRCRIPVELLAGSGAP